MKNYKYSVVFIICIILVLSGCTKESKLVEKNQKDESVSNFVETKAAVLSSKKLAIEESVDEPIGIVGNKYYFFQTIEDKENSYGEQILYEYDFDTDEICQIGKIQNISTYVSSYAIVGNKIFFARGCDDGTKTWNAHYVVDLEQKNIQMLREDEPEKYHPFVECYAVNEKQYVEFVAENMEGGYRYVISLFNVNGEGKELVATEYRLINEVAEGNMITCIDVKDEIIYALEYSSSSEEYYVCSYDLDGTQLSKESIEELNNFLSVKSEILGVQEVLWKMSTFHDYFFFSTINGNKLLLREKDNQYNIIDALDLNAMEYLKPISSNTSEQNEYVFFERGSGKFYKLYADEGELREMKLDVDGITYGVCESNKLVYTTDDGAVYLAE